MEPGATFAPAGRFLPLPEWDATLLMGLFRERILARLLDRHAISPELVRKLLGWRHPGFSAHVGESIAAQERQRLEDTAAYLVRNPLSLGKLVYLDCQQAVLYRSRMNPSLGRNFEALDPLEWLARYQVDPLVCTRCGRKMQMIAFLTDQLSTRKILDHLGLDTPPQDKPPPAREILRVAEQGRVGACRPSGRDLTACRGGPSTREVTPRGATRRQPGIRPPQPAARRD